MFDQMDLWVSIKHEMDTALSVDPANCSCCKNNQGDPEHYHSVVCTTDVTLEDVINGRRSYEHSVQKSNDRWATLQHRYNIQHDYEMTFGWSIGVVRW